MRVPLAACVLLAASLTGSARAEQTERPNILIMMVDDLGFSDFGCYGGEIETPHIDRLAANGLQFTRFYNASRCCPTRASLLTGAYPHRVGLARNGKTLSKDAPTLAERLLAAGYETAMTGKWHLSELATTDDPAKRVRWLNHELDLGIPFADPASYPRKRGFQHYYGVIWGVVDFFDPFSLVDGDDPVAKVPEDYYITDAITDRSIEYVEQFSKTDAPFFLYVAHTAPHWPLHARPEDIAKYEGRYKEGWDALRRERFQRQVKLGLFDAETPVAPVQAPRVWDKLTRTQQAYLARKMAVHAAMVDRVDQGVGRLLAALKRTGQLDNTLIVLLSDNGASPEIPGRPGYDRHGRTRDGRVALREAELQQPGRLDKVGSEESYTGIGPGWTNAANTPYRFWKKESYEGGCHTPFLVHWPAGLKAKPSTRSDAIAHVMDLAPTCLDVAGVPAGDGFRMDGKSLRPVLEGGGREGHGTLFFEHVGGRGVRRGRWKAAALKGKPWELFDTASDPCETKNLAGAEPRVLESLVADWRSWAKSLPPEGRPALPGANRSRPSK